MANFIGTTGPDSFTENTGGSDQYTAGGSSGNGVDVTLDTGGNDLYVIDRAPGQLFYSGQYLIQENARDAGDAVNITDFILASRASGLIYESLGTGGVDLQLRSGDNLLFISGQFGAGNGGVESIIYGGKTLSVGALTSLADFKAALDGLITATDRAPLASSAQVNPDEDTGVLVNLADLVQDQDGDPISFAIKLFPNQGAAELDGSTLTFTPNANNTDAAVIRLEATSGSSKPVAFEVSIVTNPVNDAPTHPGAKLAVDSGDAISLDLLKAAVDVDGDQVSLVTPNVNDTQTANGVFIVQDGELTFFSKEAHVGKETLSFDITDGNGGFGKVAVEIEVLRVNLAPVASGAAPAITVDEDTAAAAINLASLFSDPNGDALSFELLGNGGALGAVSLSPGGLFSLNPLANASGNQSVAFRVTDGDLSTNGQVALEVRPVNDAPIASDDSAALLLSQSSILIDVLGNDLDLEGEQLTLTRVLDAPNVSIEGGQLRYDRVTGASSPDNFVYEVQDASGAKSVATVSVAIQTDADAPFALDDAFRSTSAAKLVKGLKLDVVKNDVSILGKKGLDLASLTIIDNVDHGTLAIAKGKLTYQADAGFDGTDSFSYTIADKVGRVSGVADVVISGPDVI